MKRQLSLITTFAILLTIQSPISAESATPKSVAMNKLQLKNWISSLSSYDFNAIDLISNSPPLSLPTTLAQIDSELAATRLKLSNFSANLTSISDKVDTDNTATAVAKSNVAQFQTSYQSLQSQLNIISGQYSSAMNDRASALSCSILKMFGKHIFYPSVTTTSSPSSNIDCIFWIESISYFIVCAIYAPESWPCM